MALYPDACQRQVLPLWTEWMGIFEQPNQSDKVHATFLSALQGGGWMRHNEAGEKFLKVIVHTAISAATEAEGAAAEGGKMPVAFGPLDALSKLVVLMMKNVPSEPAAEGSAAEGAKAKAQLQLLARVLSIVLGHLLRHYSAAITQSRPGGRIQGFRSRMVISTCVQSPQRPEPPSRVCVPTLAPCCPHTCLHVPCASTV